MTAFGAPRVVCFGELLLRLDTADSCRFLQAERFTARYTGAEANVAVLLASLGLRAAVVSRVPANDIGQACVNQLRRYGVDTTEVLRGGDRLGLLYVEPGFGLRPTRVIYDRSHTSFSGIDPAALDWDRILDGASWLHLSGTAGAQGERVLRALRDGLEKARALGIRASLDCNYRASLWSRAQMRRALLPILPSIALFVGSFADAELFCSGSDGDGASGAARAPGAPAEAALSWGGRLRERFGTPLAGFTVRGELAGGTSAVTGYLCSASGLASGAAVETQAVDRIGSGDAFAAALIYGLLRGEPAVAVVERATRAAALKLTIPGDFALLSPEELDDAPPGRPGGVVR